MKISFDEYLGRRGKAIERTPLEWNVKLSFELLDLVMRVRGLSDFDLERLERIASREWHDYLLVTIACNEITARLRQDSIKGVEDSHYAAAIPHGVLTQ